MRFWLGKFFTDAHAHRVAFEEVFFVCVISLIPLMALPFIDQLRGRSEAVLLWDAVSSGQLYLYAFSLLGTLFWLCQKDHEHLERFPPRKYFMCLILFPACLTLIVYAFDPSMQRPLSSDLVKASIVIYCLYVFLYYVLLVFDNLEPPDVEQQLEQGAGELMSEYRENEGRQ